MNMTADAPYVQIVDIIHAGNAANLTGHAVQFHPAWRAFQKDIQGLADDAERRPENERADPK